MGVLADHEIGPDGLDYVDVMLRAGVRHRVRVEPEDPGTRFTVYVYDEDGALVAQDTAVPGATFAVTPVVSGAFRIVIDSRSAGPFRVVVED